MTKLFSLFLIVFMQTTKKFENKTLNFCISYHNINILYSYNTTHTLNRHFAYRNLACSLFLLFLFEVCFFLEYFSLSSLYLYRQPTQRLLTCKNVRMFLNVIGIHYFSKVKNCQKRKDFFLKFIQTLKEIIEKK